MGKRGSQGRPPNRRDFIMKKIAVVCANGKAGKLITNEAVSRGNDVTVFIREDQNATDATKVVTKDLFDITAEDLAGFDVVIDAFGAWTPELLPLHGKSLGHLCDAVAGTDVRLLVVGDAGSLYVDPEHTTTLSQTPDFPDAFQPLAAARAEGLADLRTRDDVRWTYVSPAAEFQAEGERTGTYQLGGEELMVGSQGPIISYADYAIAMVDLAEQGGHEHERVSVVRP